MIAKIKLDIHRGKLITFDLDFEGLNWRELSAKFVIHVNEIEYGFTGLISSSHVDIHLPPLINVIHDILTYEDLGHVDARLEFYGDHFYFIPWDGQLKIETPPKIEAKIKKTVKKKVKEDQEVQEDQEIIVDDPEPDHEVTIPDPKEKKKSKVKPQSESIFINEATKFEYLKKLKGIDEKGIRDYMARAGTKSLKIQDIILEQAENICKNPDDKFELLKSVVKTMSKIKKGKK